MIKKTYILSLKNLDILADFISENFKEGVVILQGDLASGKTTLVKKIVKKLGFDDEVTSPTFSLQQCYGDGIYHYDIYNHGLEHFLSLGMLEELEKDGIHFVEWGDDELQNLLLSVGIDTINITIKKTIDDKREYNICIF